MKEKGTEGKEGEEEKEEEKEIKGQGFGKEEEGGIYWEEMKKSERRKE
jgi:hypothetical protein